MEKDSRVIGCPSQRSVMSGGSFTADIEHFVEIGSTQSYLRRVCEEKFSSDEDIATDRVMIASADHQSNGRGKGDRKWFSDPRFKCMAMSFLFPFPTQLIRVAPILTQLLAVAAVDSLLALGFADARIKWPNDILLRSRKVGGILAEMFPLNCDFNAVIIGIGMNVDIPDEALSVGVGDNAVWRPGALKQVEGKDIGADELRVCIRGRFLCNLGDLLSSGSASWVLEEVNKRQAFFGSEVSFRVSPNESLRGYHRGVSEDGGLVLEVEGVLRTFYSGEIIG